MAPDIRVALRALRKTPAFALGAVVTVALAVGAATAIFSVVHGVLLRRLPYRNVERAFWMWSDQPGRARTPFNVPDFLDYRARARTLEGLAGFFAFGASLTGEDAGERVQGLRATGNFFQVLGAGAQLGRLLQPGDEPPGADRVVVLTDRFWTRRFGRDPAVVGRRIRLNGDEHVVVGVVAPGFATPVRDVEFIVPFSPENDPRRAARNSLNFVQGAGRLNGAASFDLAERDLDGIARNLQEEFPVENARKRGVQMMRMIDGVAGSFRAALWTISAAVAGVLLVACANLANLMLSRASGRRKEIAVQLALGASPWSVARQCLVETLIVGVCGGAIGAAMAGFGVRGLLALAPAGLPRVSEIRVDEVVLLFSIGVSVVAGVLIGVIPALISARMDIRDALHGSGRGTTAGGRRIRGALVSCEVALSVALLVLMTMLARSFANVQAVAPGFEPAGVLSARLSLPPTKFTSRDAIAGFQRAVRERLAGLPAVSHAGAINLPPLNGSVVRVPFTVEGRAIERERVPVAQYRMVSAGYFEAMRIPLIRGRTFSERDTGTARPAAVVNAALARQWLDGLEPIGSRLLVDDNDTGPRPIEIIGVVGNVQQIALDATEPTWDLYVTYPQLHPDSLGLAVGNMFWVTRTSNDPAAFATLFVRELRRIDPDVVASDISPMESSLSEAVAPRRFNVSLMAAFGLAALALAVTGIYAVIVYSVRQRAREIGIRIALGARRSNIIRLVVGDGARFIVMGLAGGIAIAVGLAQLVSTMLFGITSWDVATFVEVSVLVALVSLLACAGPALRVSSQGGVALKAE
jgi:putative ABC transport system permease protein